MDTFKLPSIPAALHWNNQPLGWNLESGDNLEILAGENTDWFIDPAGNYTCDTAPCALFTPPDKHFILSARVRVNFAATFDAGVIQVRDDTDRWAKLCFEFSPQQQPMIVSVVTRGSSDDANAVIIQGQEVFLRLALNPQTIAFHYSLDGSWWHMVRYFSLGGLNAPRVGFSSQSPQGQKCAARFSEISYKPGILQDIRSGE